MNVEFLQSRRTALSIPRQVSQGGESWLIIMAASSHFSPCMRWQQGHGALGRVDHEPDSHQLRASKFRTIGCIARRNRFFRSPPPFSVGRRSHFCLNVSCSWACRSKWDRTSRKDCISTRWMPVPTKAARSVFRTLRDVVACPPHDGANAGPVEDIKGRHVQRDLGPFRSISHPVFHPASSDGFT